MQQLVNGRNRRNYICQKTKVAQRALMTEPPFFENLTMLPPQGIHEEKFILKINESLFFKKLLWRKTV